MKGYFSTIARQSGLRFSGQGMSSGGSATAGSKSSLSPLSPIDHEEVAMVPPTMEMGNAIPAKPEAPKEAVAEFKTHRLSNKEVTAGQPSLLQPPASVKASGVPDPMRDEKARVTAVSENPPKTEMKTVAPQTEPQAVEQTVVVEPSARAHELSGRVPVPTNTSEKASEKKYFTRTAEIIGGREAEPAEVILFREIQEWIAAGPAEPEKSKWRMDEAPVSAPKTEEAVQRYDSEPGVVRIGDSHRSESMHRERMDEPSSIREQVFDLSIGTINVVIEDDQRPLQPAPQPRRESRHERQETGSQPSRLSRSYL